MMAHATVTPRRAQRFHTPAAPPAPVQPAWMTEYGVTWPAPMAPAMPPAGWRGETKPPGWFARLPLAVRVLLVLVSPLALWLVVCLLAVGGWAIPVGWLIVQAVVRPRRRGRAGRPILRRSR